MTCRAWTRTLITRGLYAVCVVSVMSLVSAISLMSTGCTKPHSEEEVTANAPVPVATEAAKRSSVESAISATGVIAAAPGAELMVMAPLPARIARLPKAEGDPVRKGDLLVEFDIPAAQADLAARQAEVAQAHARLTNARNALTRLQGLFDRGVAARKEVEDAQRDATEAEAAVANSEVARGAAERGASRTTVVAPFGGVIAKRWHNPGDLVEATATDPVLRVVDPARSEATAAVPAGVASRVRAGQAVRIRTDAGAAVSGATDDAAESSPGWTGSVLTRPTVVDPATATASVRIALRGGAAPPIGTAVHVDIVTEVRKDAVTVPSNAVVRDDGKAFVFIAGADKKAHKREVKVGVSSESATEILSGVAAGDNVIVRGQSALPDGAAIKPEEPAEGNESKGKEDGKGEKAEKDEGKSGK